LSDSSAKSELKISTAQYDPAAVDVISALFREYAESMEQDTCFASLHQELENLPGQYFEPDGLLLIATVNDEPAGCIGFQKLETGRCEMVRLWVRPEFRSQKVGIKLIEALMNRARLAGYKSMLLRTLPHRMQKAVSLYHSLGFKQIPNRPGSPEQVLTMEIAL